MAQWRGRPQPALRSPSVGDASSLLTAVAGGEKGVRFSDGCGSLNVSQDGLLVTALTVTPECHVAAQIGNFTNLSSNSFAIVTAAAEPSIFGWAQQDCVNFWKSLC
ncbi:hypothetical protein [Nocardioides ungokensis]|uniref:hypothetical protein n=1 Tax=Nocardioides ungokensis TaxID=1643322 RepID=UPI001C60D7CC|nr:hypothetical protein [Nocardioides ungokensis]